MITLTILAIVFLFIFFYISAFCLAILWWIGVFLWTVISGIFSHFLGGHK